jgi:hypothetical protein
MARETMSLFDAISSQRAIRRFIVIWDAEIKLPYPFQTARASSNMKMTRITPTEKGESPFIELEL